MYDYGIESTPSGYFQFVATKDNSTASNSFALLYHNPDVTDLQSYNWSLFGRVRMVDFSIPSGWEVSGAGVMVSDCISAWQIAILDNAIAITNGTNAVSAFITSIGSDYQEFEMRFSRNEPGEDDDSMDFLINNTLVGSVVRSDMRNVTCTGNAREFLNMPVITFGSGSSLATSTVHWNEVAFMLTRPE